MAASSSNEAVGEDESSSKHAPPMLVPAQPVIAVEHPCIIKNIDKGIKSLGGAEKLSQDLDSKGTVAASLRPDDPFAKKILSNHVKAGNILLKVTVPKRTGRKRKKGTTGPFLTEEEIQAQAREQNQSRESHAQNPKAKPKPVYGPDCPYVDGATVFRSIQDNVDQYAIEPVGMVKDVHRFRNLPDLQYSTTNSKVLKDIKDHLMPLRLSDLINYKPNLNPGVVLKPDISPPADFLQAPSSFSYHYRQNPGIKFSADETGTQHIINLNRKTTVDAIIQIEAEEPVVPKGPKVYLPPEDALTAYQRQVLAEVRNFLDKKRPVATRHVLYNHMGWTKRDKLREVIPYVGYFFTTGPFRECLVKYGVDPRSDPKYRHYQTLYFITARKSGLIKVGTEVFARIRDLLTFTQKRLVEACKFDGKTKPMSGNIYQMCDITDPTIRKILDTEDIRTDCAPTTQGWYHIGTWARAQIILRDKVAQLLDDKQVDESRYERISQWPDLFDPDEMRKTYAHEIHNPAMHAEKKGEHRVMTWIRLTMRNPKYSIDVARAAHKKAENKDGEKDGEARPESSTDAEEQQLAEQLAQHEKEMSEDLMDLDDEDIDEGPSAEMMDIDGESDKDGGVEPDPEPDHDHNVDMDEDAEGEEVEDEDDDGRSAPYTDSYPKNYGIDEDEEEMPYRRPRPQPEIFGQDDGEGEEEEIVSSIDEEEEEEFDYDNEFEGEDFTGFEGYEDRDPEEEDEEEDVGSDVPSDDEDLSKLKVQPPPQSYYMSGEEEDEE